MTHAIQIQAVRSDPCRALVSAGPVDVARLSERQAAGDLLQTLKAIPLLKGMSPRALARFARSAELRRYMPRAEVFGPGSAPSGLFFVVEGCVQLVTPSADGRQRVAELFETGAMFGEIGVLTQRPFHMHAVATDPTVLIHVDSAAVRSALDYDIGLARRLLDSMACRTQRLIDSIGVSSSLSAVARASAYLFELAGSKKPTDDSALVLPAPKATIASMLNMKPESLSRSFRRLLDLGVIRVRGRRVYVQDWAQLAGLAGRSDPR